MISYQPSFRLIHIAFILSICIGLVGSKSLASATRVDHVIVISVDGLGQDLFNKSSTYHLRQLAKEGDMAAKARTVDPPLTVPAHISMLSGVTPQNHQLLHNSMDERLQKASVPTIFDLVHQNGLKASAVVGKEKLRHVFDNGSVFNFYQPHWKLIGEFAGRFTSLIEDAAVREMREQKPEFLFVHYALPDTMGHWFKWKSLPQRMAVRMVDSSISRLVKEARRTYHDRSFAIIITADHGGHGGAHGQTGPDGMYLSEETDLKIPWIIVGAKINPEIQQVCVCDTAPTAASLLGLRVPEEWNWEGQSVVQ